MMLKKLRTPPLRILATFTLVGGLLIPLTSHAYLLPEDVLLGNDLYAPPRSRETEDRVSQQARESAARRNAEWQAEYDKQHPAPEPLPEEEAAQDSGDVPLVSDADIMELLRTIRLLERVDAQQDALRHSGAPPLAPTGAGGIIVALTMLGAVGWTLKKAGGKKGWSSREVR